MARRSRHRVGPGRRGLDGGHRPQPLRPPGRPRLHGRRVVASGAGCRGGGCRWLGAPCRHQGGLRIHGAGEPVGRYGAGPVRERAGGAGGAGSLRGGLPRGERCLAARRDVRPTVRGGRPGRHGLGAARPLCAGVRSDGALGLRRRPPERGDGAQRGGTGRGAGSRGVHPGGWDEVRRGARLPPVRHRSRRHGRGLRPARTGRVGGGKAERVIGRRRRERLGLQRRPPGDQRSGCGGRHPPGPFPIGGNPGQTAEHHQGIPQCPRGAGPRPAGSRAGRHDDPASGRDGDQQPDGWAGRARYGA